MGNNLLNQQLHNAAMPQRDIINVLDSFFFTGNFEHQVGLISNAIQDVVNKVTNDEDSCLCNDLDNTTRYVQESIHDLAELQKFLVRLHIVYDDYKKQLKRID